MLHSRRLLPATIAGIALVLVIKSVSLFAATSELGRPGGGEWRFLNVTSQARAAMPETPRTTLSSPARTSANTLPVQGPSAPAVPAPVVSTPASLTITGPVPSPARGIVGPSLPQVGPNQSGPAGLSHAGATPDGGLQAHVDASLPSPVPRPADPARPPFGPPPTVRLAANAQLGNDASVAGIPLRSQTVPVPPSTPTPSPPQPPVPARAEPTASTGSNDSSLETARLHRSQIEERERQIAERETVAAATEKRLSDRVVELVALQSRLQALQTALQERDEANWAGLVKLYEGMRPREAATIFNALETPVLLNLLDRMKPAKASPVLASMEPEKARQVTAELAAKRTRSTTVVN